MSLPDSVESVLTLTYEDYEDFYPNETLRSEVLAGDVLRNIIHPNCARLRAADNRYRLDDLLIALLNHAPHPLGQRYIALSLLVAHQEGEDGVVRAARAWLDGLLLPILQISKAIITEPGFDQSPTDEKTLQEIEAICSQADQQVLRDKVANRERYYCAITKTFDWDRATELGMEGRGGEIPHVGQHRMEVGHIIPFFLPSIAQGSQTDAARTWDMLRSWTQIDFEAFVGLNINSPTNAIFMTKVEHISFGNFDFFLEKELSSDDPNKYKLHMPWEFRCLSNGLRKTDVEFPTQEESSVEPPNPDYLKVHAAFAKVLNLCGAVEYIQRVEMHAEKQMVLHLTGKLISRRSFDQNYTSMYEVVIDS